MSQLDENERNIENLNNQNNNDSDDEEIEIDNESIISEEELELSSRNKTTFAGKNIKELILNNPNVQHVLKLPDISSNNQEIYFSFCEQNLDKCKHLVEESMNNFKSCNEYAVQMSGYLSFHQLDITKAINYYELAYTLSRKNIKYLIDIGRINYLSGNHAQALVIFTKILQMSPKNWKVFCWRALCIYYFKKKTYEACNLAIEVLLACPSASKNHQILSLIAYFCRKKGDFFSASEALKKASEMDTTNIEFLKELGYDYLKLGSEDLAFAAFGKALTYNNFHVPSLVGAAYIIQNNGDFDVALTKYRHATNVCDYSGILWNNIGMCFYGKGKYIAAISCLKKADYLIPQNWEVLFNMGLTYNALGQYASAYQYVSAALNLQSKNSTVFEALAVVLNNLKDFDNARKAFKKAASLDKGKSAGLYLNYAVFECKRGCFEESKNILGEYYRLIESGSKVDIESSYTASRLRKILEKSN